MYAIIVDNIVRQLVSEDLNLPGMHVRNVDSVKGIAEGWRLQSDGTFAPPVDSPISHEDAPERITLMMRLRMDALFRNSNNIDVSMSALSYFNRLASSEQLTVDETEDLRLFHALDNWQEAIRISGRTMIDARDYAAACVESNWPSSNDAADIKKLMDNC